MYSKNNKYMQGQKSARHVQRFSLRKLSIGTVSIALGTLVFFSNSQVSADTTTNLDKNADTTNVNHVVNDASVSTVTLNNNNSVAVSAQTTTFNASASVEDKITGEGKAADLTSNDANPGMSDANGANAVGDKSSISSGNQVGADTNTASATSDDAASAEGKITDEGKAKGLTDNDVTPGMSDANGASIVVDNSKFPSGYKADPDAGHFTFGILSLGPVIGKDQISYNQEYNTNYYIRLSTDTKATDGKYDDKAYIQLVDANDNDKILWQTTAFLGDTNKVIGYLKKTNNAAYTYSFTNSDIGVKSIFITSNYAPMLSVNVYNAATTGPASQATGNTFNYPGESTVTTRYIAKDAAGNDTIIATYDETGRIAYHYTASESRTFVGFDQTSQPSSTTGTVLPNYKVGSIYYTSTDVRPLSDDLQIARVQVITNENGRSRIELRVAEKEANISDINNSDIWKTIFKTEELEPGEYSDKGNNSMTHNGKLSASAYAVAPSIKGLDGKPLGLEDMEKAGFTEKQLNGWEKYMMNWILMNKLTAGQAPIDYYYAPQGQVRINYVTSDGTAIKNSTEAYVNSKNGTQYDVSGSNYRPETFTINGKTYRYLKVDKSLGKAGTTTVNGFKYNTTPSDVSGKISSNNVNEVYYVYEQVTYHTEVEKTKDVKRTIEYYDGVTGEPIPSKLEATVTQTATLTRNKIYDDKGNFIGYGTVSVDGSNYMINDGWKVDAQTWTQQDSADLSNYGYTAPDRASVAAVTVNVNTSNVTEKVYYGHQKVTVTPNDPTPVTPGQPINPNDPNSPLYPTDADRNNLVKDATQTIHYVGAGDKTPTDNVVTQKAAFTRTVTIDKVTGEVISISDWEGTKTFNTVNTPVVDGYHADKRVAGGLTATPDNPNVEETVTYTPNGKLVPVDPNGTPIPGADTPTYPTDPNDPTKVVPNEPIPDVPGYTPVDPSPVTPTDPGTDTLVPYVQVVTGMIKYIDDTTGKTLSSSDLPSGKVGSKINYITADKIKSYEDQGFELVSNNFADGTQTYAKEGNDFVVHLKHKTKTITPNDPTPVTPGQPINPNDPNSPLYPTDADRNNLVKDATQTIHYVGAGDKTPTDNVVTQKAAFTRTVTIDKVTGEVISISDWEGTKTFNTVNTPVVDGYHADKRVAGGLTATPDNPNVEETVTYTPNGKLVPVDPNGTPIPGADTPTYPTDPNDPTKVVPNEPIPDVPGYTPVDPSPVTPTDPGTDTLVPYTKNETLTTTPSTPTSPSEPAQPQTSVAPAGQDQATAKTEAAKQARLPQTGNDKNEATAAIGLGFASVASMLTLFGMRKKPTDD